LAVFESESDKVAGFIFTNALKTFRKTNGYGETSCESRNRRKSNPTMTSFHAWLTARALLFFTHTYMRIIYCMITCKILSSDATRFLAYTLLIAHILLLSSIGRYITCFILHGSRGLSASYIIQPNFRYSVFTSTSRLITNIALYTVRNKWEGVF